MARLSMPIDDEDHVLGLADAPVTLVEYGDYQCPSCGKARPLVAALREHMGRRLRYVFRHFPLANLHPAAERAAQAAEAAGAQGRFWEMHDLLYENQDELSEEDLIEYAEELGLDGERVARELAELVHSPRVRRDFVAGIRSGVNGTPTFFISGTRHDAGINFDSLQSALEDAAGRHERHATPTHPPAEEI